SRWRNGMGRLPGRRRPYALRRDVPGRVVDGAPAPARAGDHRGPRDRAPDPEVLHRGAARTRPASLARQAAGEEAAPALASAGLDTPARQTLWMLEMSVRQVFRAAAVQPPSFRG